MRHYINLLKHPFPESSDERSYFIQVGIISIFIGFFLYAFRPFGLAATGDNLWWICLGFALITFISCLLYNWIISKVFKIDTQGSSYTLGRWLLITMGLIVFIGIGNFLFLSTISYLAIYGIFQMIAYTLLVGIFPVIFIGTVTLLKQEKRYSEIASGINTQSLIHHNEGEKKKILGISSDKIKYIEAMQNYVRIWYSESSEILNTTHRSTINSIVSEISNTELCRCHRSFIVNTKEVTNAKGNAQGLKLSLTNISKEIPVSRKYVQEFRRQWAQ